MRTYQVRDLEAVGGIAGRHITMTLVELCSVWTAYSEGAIEALDFRVWLGTKEMQERRRYLSKERKARYSVRELHGLVGGVGGAAIRASLRRLERVGIVRARRGTMTFLRSVSDLTTVDHAAAQRMISLMPRRRQRFPLPRRVARFLAAGASRSVVSTVIGELIWCAYFRKSTGWSGQGNVKASWIADAFSVSERSVLRARAFLQEQGFLRRVRMPVWHTKAYGARYEINLSWSSLVEQGREGQTREQHLSTGDLSGHRSNLQGRLSGLESNLPPLREKYNNQEPAPSAEPVAGVSRKRPDRKPNFLSVERSDLDDAPRLLELLRHARELGVVGASDADELKFVAAAERARWRGTKNPCGLFVWSVRRGVPHLSCAEEDAARRRLRAVREPNLRRSACLAPRSSAMLLSEDAIFVRALREILWRRRVHVDPHPHLQQECPEWTRERWNRALLELEAVAPPSQFADRDVEGKEIAYAS